MLPLWVVPERVICRTLNPGLGVSRIPLHPLDPLLLARVSLLDLVCIGNGESLLQLGVVLDLESDRRYRHWFLKILFSRVSY